MIAPANPYFSPDDLGKGTMWTGALTNTLFSFKVGVFCLTAENLQAPWLLFEAGVVAKSVEGRQRVCTFLFGGLQPTEVRDPLGMFNHTSPSKPDMLRMLLVINDSIQAEMTADLIEHRLNKDWDDLEQELAKIGPSVEAPPKKRDAQDMIAEILERVRALPKELRLVASARQRSDYPPSREERLQLDLGLQKELLRSSVRSSAVAPAEGFAAFGKEMTKLISSQGPPNRIAELKSILASILDERGPASPPESDPPPRPHTPEGE